MTLNLTTDILQGTSLIGTKDILIESLNKLYASGLYKLMILPSLDSRYQVLRRVAKDLIGNIS